MTIYEKIADLWICLWSPHYKAVLAYAQKRRDEQAKQEEILDLCKEYYRPKR